MAADAKRYRADYLWETPDEDGNIYEVIDGVLYVTPIPWWVHQEQLSHLSLFVSMRVYDHDLGHVVVGARTGVVLDEYTGVLPDLVFVSHQRKHLISERGVEGPPDLIVEVLNQFTEERDRGLKLDLYAAAGVSHYWMLDTNGSTLEERVLGEDGYRLVGTFGPGEVFRPTIFPGLEVPMDEITAGDVAD
jgi:Uma2 family endonuclease